MQENCQGEALVFVDRRNTNCSKWDGLKEKFGSAELQAMWVADMDFQAPRCVQEALMRYVEQGVFGYFKAPESYFEAFLQWEAKVHGYRPRREWLRVTPGVVPAINWLLQIMTQPGDAVLVLTPVYYPFLNAVKDNDRKLVCCDLQAKNGEYTIDFALLEKTLRQQPVKAAILSSPHNPVGRVWTREELYTLLELLRKYGVFVISDEIHQDIVFEGHRHIPSATVGDYDHMLVTLTAPSKTFNLAGLQNSLLILPDADIRARYDRYLQQIHVPSSNAMGYIAAEAAYRGGADWTAEFRRTIYENYLLLRAVLEKRAPKAVISPMEGTYLMWVDLGAYVAPEAIREFMENRCGLAVDYGDWFGGDRFRTFIRLNLATSRELVQNAAEKLAEALEQCGA